MDRSKNSRSIWPHFGVIATAIVGAIWMMPAIAVASSIGQSNQATWENRKLVQDEEGVTDEDAVSTKQVDKYIAVYAAMQKNHGLTVAEAASKQGLTVDEFRALEDKIQRNPIVHERVLDALKASATGAKAAQSASPKTQ